MTLAVWDYSRTNLAPTLQYAHDGGLVFRSSASDTAATLRDVHVTCFAPDEGFVRFNLSAQFFKRAALHRKTYAMRHEPCGLLRNLQVASEFITADSVFAIDNEPCGRQPLVESDGRIFKDRASLQGELCVIVFAVAFPHALFCNP
jgi:hypothetical protein